MKQYLEMLQYIRTFGDGIDDRTGVGTSGVFGYQFQHDLRNGFPLLTTKKLHWKSIVHELLWFLRGDTNIKYLKDNGVTIWDEWADENGELGPVYGYQWRRWRVARPVFPEDCKGLNSKLALKLQQSFRIPMEGGIDQINEAIIAVRHNHPSMKRRIIVSAWNPEDVPDMKLPPCHMMFQLSRRKDDSVDLMMTQRSADSFLGVPYNIASYALLLTMIAHVTGCKPGRLIINFGDLHIYNNHKEQVDLQLTRDPMPLPKVSIIKETDNIDEIGFDDILLEDYNAHPHIAGKVAV